MTDPHPRDTTLHHLSAHTLAERIRRRVLSAEDVIQAHLTRIAEVNPTLNAIVAPRAEAALAEARQADRALEAGVTPGPLHGVPFTVKDWLDTADLVTTGGMPEHAARQPAEDATVVARMRAAGAILLGKTNVLIENEVYGRTNNPYDPAYSPCGSSSGEAAIIAAGGSPLGLGSDSGGSIREPAHCCGVAGLKPTNGRVPLTGHWPFISGMNDPRTTIGPLARTVADLALALEVIAGPDDRDPGVAPVPLGDHRDVALSGLRAARYTAHEGVSPSPEVVAVTDAAAHALEAVGVIVEDALPPRVEEARSLTVRYWRRPKPASPDEWQPDQGYNPTDRDALSAEEVERLLFEWDRFRRSMLRFMARYDLVLTPAAPHPAAPHGQPGGGIGYTLPWSLTGQPAVVVRAGSAPSGMPIAVQLVARLWRDDVALAAAAALEEALGGWQPTGGPPPVE